MCATSIDAIRSDYRRWWGLVMSAGTTSSTSTPRSKTITPFRAAPSGNRAKVAGAPTPVLLSPAVLQPPLSVTCVTMGLAVPCLAPVRQHPQNYERGGLGSAERAHRVLECRQQDPTRVAASSGPFGRRRGRHHRGVCAGGQLRRQQRCDRHTVSSVSR
jgi:hypothetical protein